MNTLLFASSQLAIAFLISVSMLATPVAHEDPPVDDWEFERNVMPFLEQYCLECHTDSEAEAEFRLDDIDGQISKGADIERWEKALEMIEIGDMPPNDYEQPSVDTVRQLTNWVNNELKKIGRGPDESRLIRPEYGNRVRHEDLFSGEFKGPSSSPSRIWRKTPQIHAKFEEVLRLPKSSSPFSPKGGKGFQDYAMLLANESTISAMRINASNYAAEILDGPFVYPRGEDGKPDRSRRERKGSSKFREFNEIQFGTSDLTTEQSDSAVRRTFEILLTRPPTAAESNRYSSFLLEGIQIAGRRKGLEALLTAVMLSPEFVYRMEIGLGEQLPDGRRRLSPDETAWALAYALTDSPPDEELRKAVEEGRLESREDIAKQVRRMLSADTHAYWNYEVNHTVQSRVDACPNPRVLRFFREFFGYDRVFDVFKDASRNNNHKPQFLFKDADLFVLSILEEDRQVLKKLLTSNRYVVHYADQKQADRTLKKINEKIEKNKQKAAENPNQKPRRDVVAEKIAKGLTPVLGGYRGGRYYTAYNLQQETWDYPLEQPFSLPNRYGMLTHPAWLVAHSSNFETDPIRRGKWIQEHLLAGIIPEVPIGVDAALEDNPHKTVRQRLKKTTEATCWRCHKKMNPLGFPFEAWDDFGAFRVNHIFDSEGRIIETDFERASLAKKGRQRKKQEPSFTFRPIDTSGYLAGTGDPQLDGKVADAQDLLDRLARSDRVRQSFIRHVFRYWMGRNETLDDSPVLMEADRVYVESNGSFRELLVSLLTSDSFLMRK